MPTKLWLSCEEVNAAMGSAFNTSILRAGPDPAVRIDWLEDEASRLEPTNRWERLAKQAAASDLVVLRRRLAERILAKAGSRSPRDAVRKYLAERAEAHGRLLLFMRELARQGVDSVDAVIVATRTIERNLI